MPRRYPTTPMCDGELLARFEPTVRDSDVFIATAAKCGQTWLQTLLFHLKTRGSQPHFRDVGLLGVSPWLELPSGALNHGDHYDHAMRLAQFEALDDPRVFKMHVVWDEIPRPPQTAAKVLTITRDPRDVPYSMFAHIQGLSRPVHTAPERFEEYFERWMEFGFYFKFVRSLWPHRHDPDVLWLRYEDMHRDLATQIDGIVEFLGWDVAPQHRARAMELVDFERLRSTEKTDIFTGDNGFKADAHFFREGGTGKNRARLTEDQERRIIDRARAELGDDCCEFILTLDRS